MSASWQAGSWQAGSWIRVFVFVNPTRHACRDVTACGLPPDLHRMRKRWQRQHPQPSLRAVPPQPPASGGAGLRDSAADSDGGAAPGAPSSCPACVTPSQCGRGWRARVRSDCAAAQCRDRRRRWRSRRRRRVRRAQRCRRAQSLYGERERACICPCAPVRCMRTNAGTERRNNGGNAAPCHPVPRLIRTARERWVEQHAPTA